MNEKINLGSNTESFSLENLYKNPQIADLRQKYYNCVNHFGYDIMIDNIFKFSETDGLKKEELRKHLLYHIIIFSTPRLEDRHSFLDYSDEEIKNNPQIAKFVNDDLKIKKFIEDEYEKMQKEKDEEEIINF